MNFYQACYGKPDGINWTVFNDTIPDGCDSHKALFVKASSYCGPDMIRSVLGGKLPGDLYELIVLKDATCLFRAKYWNASAEVSDSKETRDVMFAHGFVFTTKEVIQHPGYLLSISDNNFKFTVDETMSQPQELACDLPLVVDEAMTAAGLTKKTWTLLMECIYTQRDSRSDEALYIKATSREAMKALIYCILIALPKQLRHSFAFSNENSVSGTMFGKDARGELIQPQRIFFTDHIPAYATYFDPQSGATNADIRDIQDGVAAFPSYKIFRDGSANAYAAYCDLLDEVFAELKLPEMASLGEVELASLFIEGDAELVDKNERDSWKYLLNLLKKLRESHIQSAYTDNYVANVLEIFDKRGLMPNDTIMRYVSTLSDNSTSLRLGEIYKKLQVRMLMNEGKAAIESFLIEAYKKGGETFHDWCERVSAIDGGHECVADFYVTRIKNAKDYDEIDVIYRDGLRHLPNDEWDKETITQFLHISTGRFSCKVLSTNCFELEFVQLREAIFKTFELNGATAYQQLHKAIAKQFWEEFELKYFDFTTDCINNCKEMGFGKQTGIEPLFEIYNAVMQAKAREIHPRDAFDCIWQFWRDVEDECDQDPSNVDMCKIMYSKIQEFVVSKLRNCCGNILFKEWASLACLSDDSNPLVKLYYWRIPLVCDPDVFEDQLTRDKEMQKLLQKIDIWLSENRHYPSALRLVAGDAAAVKVFKCEARIVADYEKREAAAAKKQEREFRRQEKKLGREANQYYYDDDDDDEFVYGKMSAEPIEKKGFLGGILGGKRKNKW